MGCRSRRLHLELQSLNKEPEIRLLTKNKANALSKLKCTIFIQNVRLNLSQNLIIYRDHLNYSNLISISSHINRFAHGRLFYRL